MFLFRSIMSVFMTLVGAFSIMIFFFSMNQEKELERIRQTGKATTGVVTDMKELLDHQADKNYHVRRNYYAPIIEFQNDKNEKIIFTSTVYFVEDVPYPKVGESVELRYNELMPKDMFGDFDAVLVGQYEEYYKNNTFVDSDKDMDQFIMGAVGFSFFIMGFVLMGFLIYERFTGKNISIRN